MLPPIVQFLNVKPGKC